ncbi:hypothetical protein CRYUN_Cryun05aG0200400 [Craigia yunnanensis]
MFCFLGYSCLKLLRHHHLCTSMDVPRLGLTWSLINSPTLMKPTGYYLTVFTNWRKRNYYLLHI